MLLEGEDNLREKTGWKVGILRKKKRYLGREGDERSEKIEGGRMNHFFG